MKKIFLLTIIPSLVTAENVLLVSNNDFNSQGLFDFLTAEGHVVTRDNRNTGPLANDAVDFDIVIVARASNSGDYATNDAEVASWNSLIIPIINFNAYIYRQNRWGWITTDSLTGASTSGIDSPFAIPSHPYVQSLTAPENEIFATPPATATCPVADLVTGGEVIATRNGGTNLGVFKIPIGSVLKGTTTQAARIGFTAGNGGAWNNVNDNGKQILRNIIDDTLNSPDSDADGMDDAYELANTSPASATALLPGDDDDADGLTNLQEFLGLDASNTDHGFGQTRASLEDSDDDGIEDVDEIEGNLNTTFGNAPTSPVLKDTDDDGVEDGAEVFGSMNIANGNAPTNPALADSDGDGMDDGYEITNSGSGGLNPNLNDAAGNLDGDPTPLTNIDEYLGTTLGVQTRADLLDTDNDGYDDVVESNAGFWTSPSNTGTNATIPDSDGDGIMDGQENADLASFPGQGVFPTNSDPNLTDTDGDGITDDKEVNTYATNPANTDTDGDTYQDEAELFAYQTNPTDAASVPSNAQLAALIINFTRGGSSVSGFQDYIGAHEDLGSFVPQNFNAFGTTVTVTPSWNDGGSAVHPEAPQMIRRGANLGIVDAPNLMRDWVGTDNRRVPGDPMTLTLSNLPSGTYQWSSLHHDTDNQTGLFNVTFNHAGGSDVTSGLDITDTTSGGVAAFGDYTRFEQTFISDGSDVTIEFSSDSFPNSTPIQEIFFVMNAFTVTATDPAQGPTITSVNFNSAGDLELTFIPADTGFTLTTSLDLQQPFVAVPSASFDGTDTFTVPAAFVTDPKRFFRIER